MTRTPRWLSRLVVVGAGSAAIAAGVVPLSATAAFAGAGDTATTITLTPDTATDTVGNCTAYKVQTNANAVFDVEISQTTTQTTANTIDFCDVSNFSTFQAVGDNPVSGPNAGGTNTCPDATAGGSPATQQTAKCDGQFQADGSGDVEFGVTSDAPGSMLITAYNDVNGDDTFSNNETPNDKSTETWVANQAGGANALTCQPTSQSKNVFGTATWSCTVKTSQGTGANANTLDVYYDVNSGPDASNSDTLCAPDNSTTTGSAGGFNGVYTCSLSNGGGVGTDSITTFVDNNANTNLDAGEPTAQTSVTWVAAVPNNSAVQADCSPNEEVSDATPSDGNESFCELPLTTSKVTLTATVKANGTPVNNALVTWFEDFNDADSDVPGTGVQCTTNANGTCSVDVTESNQVNNDEAGFYACVETAAFGQTCSDDTIVEWHTPNSDDARNITVSPATATQQSGGSQDFVIKVTDRHSNGVGGVCVGLDEAGPGHFAAGTGTTGFCPFATAQSYGLVCTTATNGTCTVTVVSQATESGDETVTATIDPANYGGPTVIECSAPAGTTFAYGTPSPGDPSAGAPAGNCTATGKVTWGAAPPPPGKHAIGLHLACFSHHPGKIKCVAQTGPATKGVTVKFFNKKGKKVATDVTNKAGKAHFIKTGKKSGKTYVFQAHANHTATTYSADSKRAKVTVQ